MHLLKWAEGRLAQLLLLPSNLKYTIMYVVVVHACIVTQTPLIVYKQYVMFTVFGLLRMSKHTLYCFQVVYPYVPGVMLFQRM